MAEPKNHAQTISELTVAAAYQPVVIAAAEGREFVAVPQGNGSYKLEQITSPNKAEVLMPKLVTQHVKLQTVQSLVDYVNRFRNDDTMLFADIDSNSILSIIDYHTESTSDEAGVKAKLAQHRAALKLPFSQEWQVWTGVSGKLMSHRAFATFLEENSVDIVTPPGADLLELCRDLQVINNVNFSSSVRNGDYNKIEFKKENDAASAGSVSLPLSIGLSVPVYFGEPPVKVTAFMRRKIDDGQLTLGVQLSRAENIRQDEFNRIVTEVQIGVDHLTTVYGTPA